MIFKTARLYASCLMVSLLVPATLPAWNDEGHMTVAYVAYKQLSPTTKARVDSLLQLNPYYSSKWMAMIPAGTSQDDTKMMVFMIAATWPDQIRRDPQYHNDGANGGDRPKGPTSSQNIGYTDHLRHKYWHFVDTPFSKDGTAIPALPTPNAGTQIVAFRAALASNQPDPLKSYDLVWLLHLVGDVHQPLHSATRVSAGMPDGDAGGNLVMLCSSPCKNELHAFWDDLIGTQTGPAAAVSAASGLPAPDANKAKNTDTTVWIQESFEEAQQQVYMAPIGSGTGPFTITAKYRADARVVARERVALAGARLAEVLNKELK